LALAHRTAPMPIELNCPGCGKQLRLADEHAGKAGRCPACQATFQIPTHSEQQAQQQTPASPFGSSSSPPPSPAGNLFPQQPQQPPHPFASTSGMPSPYGGTNPYSSPQAPMYGAQSQPGEGTATASMVLGIVAIVASILPCCCGGLNLFISIPCGIIGLVLAFQTPPERRQIGLILNIVGLGLNVLFFVLWLVWFLIAAANQPQGPEFNF